jgi:hypothetical protein
MAWEKVKIPQPQVEVSVEGNTATTQIMAEEERCRLLTK